MRERYKALEERYKSLRRKIEENTDIKIYKEGVPLPQNYIEIGSLFDIVTGEKYILAVKNDYKEK